MEYLVFTEPGGYFTPWYRLDRDINHSDAVAREKMASRVLKELRLGFGWEQPQLPPGKQIIATIELSS